MNRFRAISEKPTRLRVTTKQVDVKPQVDREAKVIRGLSAITRGEALGHGAWVDLDSLQTITHLGNAAKNGIKSRFTHPGLSSDGLGTLLGRSKNFRMEGDQVKSDLHIADSAFSSPKGNLGQHAMDLAEESPDLAGMSIVFTEDRAESDNFQAEHSDEDGDFTSPDMDNQKNLPHFRVGALHANDLVDEPAANPDGMFSTSILDGADALFEFIFCEGSEPQELNAVIHPERIKRFTWEWLDARGLRVAPKLEEKEPIMPEDKTTADLEKKPETQDPIDTDAIAKEAALAERARIQEITALADGYEQVELGETLIGDGTPKDRALSAIKDAALQKLWGSSKDVGANAEPKPAEKKKASGTRLENGNLAAPEHSEILKFQAENEGMSYAQAMDALSAGQKKGD